MCIGLNSEVKNSFKTPVSFDSNSIKSTTTRLLDKLTGLKAALEKDTLEISTKKDLNPGSSSFEPFTTKMYG